MQPKRKEAGSKVAAARGSVRSTDQLHRDSGGYEAHFGGGTRLTVLGKKLVLHVQPPVGNLSKCKKEKKTPNIVM